MLTCKEATHLVSQQLDRKLSRRERMALRLHVWMCRNCQRFEKQLHFIRNSVRQGANEEKLPENKPMPNEARERIRKALHDHDSDD